MTPVCSSATESPVQSGRLATRLTTRAQIALAACACGGATAFLFCSRSEPAHDLPAMHALQRDRHLLRGLRRDACALRTAPRPPAGGAARQRALRRRASADPLRGHLLRTASLARRCLAPPFSSMAASSSPVVSPSCSCSWPSCSCATCPARPLTGLNRFRCSHRLALRPAPHHDFSQRNAALLEQPVAAPRDEQDRRAWYRRNSDGPRSVACVRVTLRNGGRIAKVNSSRGATTSLRARFW